ncbi:hypothetical protein C8J57DRAFT_1528255 [Mycena rebaudengoi]|nr:hypothetical protein C8J57DRAFT_1528255 [Mycena rebaudengoi]
MSPGKERLQRIQDAPRQGPPRLPIFMPFPASCPDPKPADVKATAPASRPRKPAPPPPKQLRKTPLLIPKVNCPVCTLEIFPSSIRKCGTLRDRRDAFQAAEDAWYKSDCKAWFELMAPGHQSGQIDEDIEGETLEEAPAVSRWNEASREQMKSAAMREHADALVERDLMRRQAGSRSPISIGLLASLAMSPPKSIVFGNWDNSVDVSASVNIDPVTKDFKREALRGGAWTPQVRRWVCRQQDSRSPEKKKPAAPKTVSPRKNAVREAFYKCKAESWRIRDERVKQLAALRAMPRKGPPPIRVPPSPPKKQGPSMQA